MLRCRHGAIIIDDTTCALCGAPTYTQAHLFCECPATQHARDKIYTHLTHKIARATNLATKQVQKRVKSCWTGTKQRSMPSPLMELTCVGFLTLEFR
jgi:hypothetical protein